MSESKNQKISISEDKETIKENENYLSDENSNEANNNNNNNEDNNNINNNEKQKQKEASNKIIIPSPLNCLHKN